MSARTARPAPSTRSWRGSARPLPGPGCLRRPLRPSRAGHRASPAAARLPSYLRVHRPPPGSGRRPPSAPRSGARGRLLTRFCGGGWGGRRSGWLGSGARLRGCRRFGSRLGGASCHHEGSQSEEHQRARLSHQEVPQTDPVARSRQWLSAAERRPWTNRASVPASVASVYWAVKQASPACVYADGSHRRPDAPNGGPAVRGSEPIDLSGAYRRYPASYPRTSRRPDSVHQRWSASRSSSAPAPTRRVRHPAHHEALIAPTPCSRPPSAIGTRRWPRASRPRVMRSSSALFTVAVVTGLRQGELLGLRWSDVDLSAGTLTVRPSLPSGWTAR